MRNYLLLLFIIFSFSNLSAQFIRGWGIKAGMTISNQTWDYSSSLDIDFETEDKIGLNVGLFMEILDLPFFSIVTELNYIQKGMELALPRTTADYPTANGFVNWDTRIDYLNIAAMAKVRLNYGIIKPYILVGPKIDYEISKSFSDINASDIEDQFDESRLGAKVGIGTEINLLPMTLLVEILYDADFNELYNKQNLKVSSNSFDLRIGIFF